MEDKIKTAFEEGRALEKRVNQIGNLCEEIFLGSGKEDKVQRTKLKEVLEEAWEEYLVLANKYGLGKEILRVQEIYDKAKR